MDPIYAAILIQQWADTHWWLAFWLAFWALVFAYGALLVVNRTIIRVLRFVKILARGWPPEHLDADGDYRPLQQRPPLALEEISKVGDREHTVRTYREEAKPS